MCSLVGDKGSKLSSMTLDMSSPLQNSTLWCSCSHWGSVGRVTRHPSSSSLSSTMSETRFVIRHSAPITMWTSVWRRATVPGVCFLPCAEEDFSTSHRGQNVLDVGDNFCINVLRVEVLRCMSLWQLGQSGNSIEDLSPKYLTESVGNHRDLKLISEEI